MQYRPTRSELARMINQARLDRHISIRSAARIAGPSPRIVDTVVVDYAAVGSVVARWAS